MRYIKTLRVIAVLAVVSTMILAGFITGLGWFLLRRLNVFTDTVWARMLAPVWLLVFSIAVGTALSLLFSRRVLTPISELVSANRAITQGDYSVRVRELDGEGELQELLRSFNLMAAELEGTEILRNDFIDSFSHEFKTPIVSIRGFARRLRHASLTDEQRETYLDFIDAETARLSNMSTNILMLSRLENQMMLGEKTGYLLDEQIRDCALLLERDWEGKNIELSIDMPEISFCSNRELLSQVWINILENAIKFTDDGGKITISGSIRSDHVTVSIADSGVGMSQETLEHIFDKFYQGDKARTSKGNGLGLAIVRRIVELCDGDIGVESQEGIGTVFRVKLPI